MLVLSYIILAYLLRFQAVGANYHDLAFDLTSSENDNNLDLDRFLNITPPDAPSEFPTYISVPVRSLHQTMFESVFNLLLDKGLFFNSESSRDETPYNYTCPTCFNSSLDFKLGETGETHEKLMEYLEDILRNSPRVSHPFYLAKSGSGLDPYALAADWLGTTMNTVLLSYYMAPVFTLMEITMIRRLRVLIGYQYDEEGGVVTPGTSVGNTMAIHLALQKKYPGIKYKGLIGAEVPKFAIFLSTDASSSFEKAQIFSGFPKASLVRVEVDEQFRMSVQNLEEKIKEALVNNIVPLMVVATAGSPILGAIDPIDEIANVSDKHSMWLHVDAGRAGHCLVSEKQKSRLTGIHRSDSVTWSASRLLASPHTSTFLLTKEGGISRRAFEFKAGYVFYKSELYNSSYDLGDSVIQTSRRPEIVKTWYLWKGKGLSGLAAHVDRAYENLEFFIAETKNAESNGFRLILENFETPMVSFVYVPVDMRADEDNSTEFIERINKVTLKLKERLLTTGVLQISLSSCPKTGKYFFTLSLYNSVLTQPDLTYIVEQIRFYGEQLKLPAMPRRTNPPPRPETYPSFVSAPIEALHKGFYRKVFQLFLKKGYFFQNKRKEPAMRFRSPKVLEKILDLELGNDSLSQDELFADFEKVIQYSAHYGHPYWIFQLMSGLDPYTAMADYVGSAINSPMLTYEDSPAFTLMEREVLLAFRKLVGYPNGEGDGVINDGGSLTNMIGIALARYKKYVETRDGGNSIVGKEMVFFVSHEAHYSFKKGAFMEGFGALNCVGIETDKRGRMNVTELRIAIDAALAAGKVPFMVAGTTGTTILGSIDPLDEIADVCKEYNLWFHIDGIYGGSILMSEKYRPRLKGMERSDSFGCNWHKVFGGTHTMAIQVIRHPGILSEVFGSSSHSDFFSPDNLYDRKVFDAGDKHLQLTKRANVFKIWFLWKAKGINGLALHVNHIYARAELLVTEMKNYGCAFEPLLSEFDLVNICFYYIPKRMRGMARGDEYRFELEKVTQKLYKILCEKGIVNVVAQNRGIGDVSFLKLPLMSSGTTEEDVKYIVKVIDFIGQDL